MRGIESACKYLVPFTYRDLESRQRSMRLVEVVYSATRRLPSFERYGIAGQIRRAAVSIPSNIAEGHCRRTTNAFLNHVSIALGSHGELCTLIELSVRLGFLDVEERNELTPLTDSVGRLLYGLRNSLERKRAS